MSPHTHKKMPMKNLRKRRKKHQKQKKKKKDLRMNQDPKKKALKGFGGRKAFAGVCVCGRSSVLNTIDRQHTYEAGLLRYPLNCPSAFKMKYLRTATYGRPEREKQTEEEDYCEIQG